jgi:hypothetical protein
MQIAIENRIYKYTVLTGIELGMNRNLKMDGQLKT